jgi:integrase
VSYRTAHSIIDLNILEGAVGNTIPLLVLMDGTVSFLALLWARHLMLHANVSPNNLSRKIIALGRFYDYFVLEMSGKKIARDAMVVVLERFYQARRFGLAALNWPPVAPNTARFDEEAVTLFSEWCGKNLGFATINPTERQLVSNLNLRHQLRFRREQSHRANADKLGHLQAATLRGKGIVDVPAYVPPRRDQGSVDYPKKYFPPTKVGEFFRGLSLRDSLYFLLLFFGGLRASEPLHLFVTDVTIQPTGLARVCLSHPELGSYQWSDFHGRECRGNRALFLSQRYGLGPRNWLGERHPLHAGWKGMHFDHGAYETEVYWLREDACRLFATLHIEYMKTVRTRVHDNHPFYFVNNAPGKDFGNPATLSNMNKSFYRGASRVGLSSSDEGVNPHGGRHYFGYFHANVYRTELEMLKLYIHHVSPQSTQVYYSVTPKTAHSELKKAWAKISQDFPESLSLNSLFKPELT